MHNSTKTGMIIFFMLTILKVLNAIDNEIYVEYDI